MPYIFRLIITVTYRVLVCIFGRIYCLFSPQNPEHVVAFGHMFGRLVSLCGLKVECRMPVDAQNYGNAIYTCNHQNNYDMVTAVSIVQPPTVTVSKRNLLWIPFSGQLYRLTGNLLVDRSNRARAYSTIAAMVNHFKKRRILVWMFLEGTCNHGRGLPPLKVDASHVTVVAGIPVIPVCVSVTSNKVKLNRLSNGLATVEMLSPADISHFGKDRVCELTAHYYTLMEQKIAELDKEVAERGAAGKV